MVTLSSVSLTGKGQMKPRTGCGIPLFVLALLLAACARATATPSPTSAPVRGMGQASSSELAPLVTGFYNGGEVLFIHTEASDPDVAKMLTAMMGPQVLLVPELAQVARAAPGGGLRLHQWHPGHGSL